MKIEPVLNQPQQTATVQADANPHAAGTLALPPTSPPVAVASSPAPIITFDGYGEATPVQAADVDFSDWAD